MLSEVDLSYSQMVLGTSVEVETLHGAESLEIPPGTAPGSHFELHNKGIARLNGRGNGHHVVEVRLSVPHPRDLSEEQLEQLRLLAELEGSKVRDGERKVLDRVRDLFG